MGSQRGKEEDWRGFLLSWGSVTSLCSKGEKTSQAEANESERKGTAEGEENKGGGEEKMNSRDAPGGLGRNRQEGLEESVHGLGLERENSQVSFSKY